MNLRSSRLTTALRVAAPAAAALALTLAVAGPASASPSLVTRSGSEIRYSALPGEANDVTFSTVSGQLVVTDAASPLTPGPGCVRINANSARCGTAATVTRIRATLGDEDDRADNQTAIASDLDGGSGQDILLGGNGTDRLTDTDGWDAGPTPTTFNGRAGNDTLISRNLGYDRVECGSGFDIAIADNASLDTVVPGCEFVQRF
ncbi:hypothetical protein [Streptomyces sp. NPDC101132]|uniref:hypothetical protein n=1 Tax=Streptomyces sp. NPDC101132 TaxID=3366110 RepID=UPI003817BBF6